MQSSIKRTLPLPTNWRTAYPSEFLKPIDLTRDGQFITANATVDRVVLAEIKNVKGKLEQVLILYFIGKKKGLIANVTICKQMQEVSGTENPNNWPGVVVQLYVDTKVKNPQDAGRLTAQAVRVAQPTVNAPEKLEDLPDDEDHDDLVEPDGNDEVIDDLDDLDELVATDPAGQPEIGFGPETASDDPEPEKATTGPNSKEKQSAA